MRVRCLVGHLLLTLTLAVQAAKGEEYAEQHGLRKSPDPQNVTIAAQGDALRRSPPKDATSKAQAGMDTLKIVKDAGEHTADQTKAVFTDAIAELSSIIPKAKAQAYELSHCSNVSTNEPFATVPIPSHGSGFAIQPATKSVTASAGLLACTVDQLILCPQSAVGITDGTVLVGVLDTLLGQGPSECTLITRKVIAISSEENAVVLNTTDANLADIFTSYNISIPSVAAAVQKARNDSLAAPQGRSLLDEPPQLGFQVTTGPVQTSVSSQVTFNSDNGLLFNTDFSFVASTDGPDGGLFVDIGCSADLTFAYSFALDVVGNAAVQLSSRPLYSSKDLGTLYFDIPLPFLPLVLPATIDLSVNVPATLQFTVGKNFNAVASFAAGASINEQVTFTGGTLGNTKNTFNPTFDASISASEACTFGGTVAVTPTLQAAFAVGYKALTLATISLAPSLQGIVAAQTPADPKFCAQCVGDAVQRSIAVQPHVQLALNAALGPSALLGKTEVGAQVTLQAPLLYDADIGTGSSFCSDGTCDASDFSCKQSPSPAPTPTPPAGPPTMQPDNPCSKTYTALQTTCSSFVNFAVSDLATSTATAAILNAQPQAIANGDFTIVSGNDVDNAALRQSIQDSFPSTVNQLADTCTLVGGSTTSFMQPCDPLQEGCDGSGVDGCSG